jgi:hypothetical protein
MTSPPKIESQTVQFFTPLEKPYGLSYGKWTVKWWEWAFSAPTSISPLLDDDGTNAAVNQSGPVWFLAGTIAENFDPRKVVNRKCTLPDDKSIIFPVINYEMNPLENPEFGIQSDLIEHVRTDIDDIVTKDAVVDMETIPTFRIQSDPASFTLSIESDNGLGVPAGVTNIAADGYWVFLKPLSVGKHEIYFHGSCAAGTRCTAVNYHIEVIKEN